MIQNLEREFADEQRDLNRDHKKKLLFRGLNVTSGQIEPLHKKFQEKMEEITSPLLNIKEVEGCSRNVSAMGNHSVNHDFKEHTPFKSSNGFLMRQLSGVNPIAIESKYSTIF